MIRCVIIDDEQPAINVIKKYIDRLPNLQLIGETINPLAGIEIIKKEKPDVVFLDIQMDEMNGIDVMKIIADDTLVVFCTAYSEFAVTSYDLDAIAMAAQPSICVEAIPNDYIFVKAGLRGKMLKIDIDDIDFVEAMNNYVAFHRGTQKTLAYLTLKELEERLPSSQFMRVQKSFIVALKQISSMENNELILKKLPTRIPIGANYKEAFMERMKSKLMS